MVKRFVVLTWNLTGEPDFTLLRENEQVMTFVRKKEALRYAKTVETQKGFNYRAVAVWL